MSVRATLICLGVICLLTGLFFLIKWLFRRSDLKQMCGWIESVEIKFKTLPNLLENSLGLISDIESEIPDQNTLALHGKYREATRELTRLQDLLRHYSENLEAQEREVVAQFHTDAYTLIRLIESFATWISKIRKAKEEVDVNLPQLQVKLSQVNTVDAERQAGFDERMKKARDLNERLTRMSEASHKDYLEISKLLGEAWKALYVAEYFAAQGCDPTTYKSDDLAVAFPQTDSLTDAVMDVTGNQPQSIFND